MVKIKKGETYEIKDHQLYFSRFSVLFRLFRENKVSTTKRWMQCKIIFFASLTQIFILLQRVFYKNKISSVDLSQQPPIFILGHWRSGTTHLHYLMTKDKRMGFASNYNVFLINICLLGKGWLDRILAPFLPDKRPMDNVRQTLYDPAEEDQAVANISTATGINVFFFPKNRTYFEKYTLMKGLSVKEKRHWQRAYQYALQLISYSSEQKRLVLKCPTNTARPTELKELFPGSKFVFIHRNPFEVYRSTRKLYKHSTESQYLQDVTEEEIEDCIFTNYTELMQSYLEKRGQLKSNDLIEISYDQLSKNPMETMRLIYDQLELGNWEDASTHIMNYLQTVDDYEKNHFKPLPDRIVARIQEEWAFSFEIWGYSTIHGPEI